MAISYIYSIFISHNFLLTTSHLQFILDINSTTSYKFLFSSFLFFLFLFLLVFILLFELMQDICLFGMTPPLESGQPIIGQNTKEKQLSLVYHTSVFNLFHQHEQIPQFKYYY